MASLENGMSVMNMGIIGTDTYILLKITNYASRRWG
jgi:hypothetical protein